MCFMRVPGAHGGQKAVLESLKLDRCEPSHGYWDWSYK